MHRQCQTSRDFVPWRFSDAGRRSAWIASSCRHPKTLYGAYWCQGESGGGVEAFFLVNKVDLSDGHAFFRLSRGGQPPKRMPGAAGGGGEGGSPGARNKNLAATPKR